MRTKALLLVAILLLFGIGCATAEDVNITQTNLTVGKFRVAPVVKVRPLNDIIRKDQPTLIEFYFSNPALNDVSLTVEAYLSVPSGVHIYAEGFSWDAGAGTLHGHFVVPPGNSRLIQAEVIGAKPGEYFVHAVAMYYPDDNKDDYRQISLTHPFKVVEPISSFKLPSVDPMLIIFVAVILGGLAIIFAIRKKPPQIRIEE